MTSGPPVRGHFSLMLIRYSSFIGMNYMPGTTRVEIRTLKIGRYVAIDDDAYKILSTVSYTHLTLPTIYSV